MGNADIDAVGRANGIHFLFIVNGWFVRPVISTGNAVAEIGVETMFSFLFVPCLPAYFAVDGDSPAYA